VTAEGPNADDEDDDLRELLRVGSVSTTPKHDAAVLQAARDSTRRRARRSSGPVWMALAAALVLIVLGTLWLIQSRGTGRDHRPVTASRSTTRPTPAAALVIDAVLAPGLTRGAAALPRLSVGAGTASVRLGLQEVPPALDVNDAVLSLNSRSGNQVWRSPVPQARPIVKEGVLTVEIPVSGLAPGQYELSLHSRTAGMALQADYYYFEFSRE
jgi:hypothetical protein